MNANEYFSNAATVLTALVLVGAVVAILHAIAVFALVDALSVPAQELRRQASCTKTRENCRLAGSVMWKQVCDITIYAQPAKITNSELVRANVTEKQL